MSGLMMVFLFISIALMRHALIERDKIKEVAVAYQKNQVSLYEALQQEFAADLKKWNAEIDRETLAFEFKTPDVLFGIGSANIRPGFRKILEDFFPRYMKTLGSFRSSINEVRVEGHTSSAWSTGVNPRDAYFFNMNLSQERTRSVLFFVEALDNSDADRQWIRSHIAAVGFSSSRPVTDSSGKEDAERSRRVTFRVVTNAETQIRKILQE